MEYGLDTADIERIKKIFSNNARIKRVIIFGSRAMGNYKPGSDIDMAVVGDLSLNDMLDLDNELEKLGLLYKFDIQNIASIKDADVLAHIIRAGKEFYTPNA